MHKTTLKSVLGFIPASLLCGAGFGTIDVGGPSLSHGDDRGPLLLAAGARRSAVGGPPSAQAVRLEAVDASARRVQIEKQSSAIDAPKAE